MHLPEKIEQKYLNRLSSLASEGWHILHVWKASLDQVQNQPGDAAALSVESATQSFYDWRTNCLSLFHSLLPFQSPHRHVIEEMARNVDPVDVIPRIRGVLEALDEDFREGFLGDLRNHVEAELAADYLGQAERLITEGSRGQFDHVPAAVLVGAVLEKSLRTICGQQHPSIPLTSKKGQPKTLNPLIDDLKEAGLFNEAKAKQLRAWADIRNHAAHGNFKAFNQTDVEQMIQGIQNFIADYLK